MLKISTAMFRAFPSSDLPRVRTFVAAMAALALLALAWPALAWPALAAAVAAVVWTTRGAAKPKPASGPSVMLLGRDAANGQEIAHDSDRARQHLLVVGDEAVRLGYFVNLLSNATEPGSGGILVSTDPDRTLHHKVLSLCAAAGRQDDLLVLNFDRGATSHTFNPFASGSSDGLTQTILELVRPSLDRDGAMWVGRAVALLTGLLSALVWKRDEGRMALTARAIADHSDLRALCELREEPDLPKMIASTLTAYLQSLPGFEAERGPHQRQTAVDQHLFLQQRLVDVLNQIDIAYPRIFRSASPDVIMEDVIQRRRILLVILPDAENPAQGTVGRLILAALKNLAGSTLGSTPPKPAPSTSL